MQKHPYMQEISALANKQPRQPYTLKNWLIYYKHLVVIPPKSNLVQQLLQAYHDFPLGGHSGVLRTYKRLAQQFY